MRRWTAGFLCILMVLSLAACGNTTEENRNSSVSVIISEELEETSSKELATTESDEANDKSDKEAETEKSSNAVVYFSATGTTKEVARIIAGTLNTEAVEIIPEDAYSSDDLDYNNDNCRANKEMNDDSARPAIKNDLSAVMDCDSIYIGYPIWWGTAPRIIQTFLEAYDLSGKTVYTFCTSGGSGVEKSVSDLQELYKDVTIVNGKRFSAGASEEEVKEWLNEIK